MSNLAPAQLFKYDSRIQKFIDVVNGGEKLELVKGGSVSVTGPKGYESVLLNRDANAAKKLVFEGTDKKPYTLFDFKKGKAFGGGAGSGAGSAITELGESAQCYYCAAIWKNRMTNFSKQALIAASSDVYATDSVEKVVSTLTEDWVNSSISVAKKLRDFYGSTKFEFHRGSSFVDQINAKYKQLNKDGFFTNINKWTPADIWLVKKGFNKRLPDFDSFVDFNTWLIKQLQDETLIGVSLKKVEGKSVKLDRKNFDRDRPSFKFENITLGKRGFFESKDVYAIYDGGEIQFRTFPTWQGEIKGKYANEGKVSGGPLGAIVKRKENVELITQDKVIPMLQKEPEKFIEMFYNFYKEVERSPLPLKEFGPKVLNKETEWIVSKFLGTNIAYYIHKSKDREGLINSILLYASSQSELSAPYILAKSA